MGVTHWVRARSGDSYTDRNGDTKESYVTIGRLVEGARGGKMVILDSIPFSWLSGGKPVVMYLQPNDKTRPAVTERERQEPEAEKPKQRSLDPDDDIPF